MKRLILLYHYFHPDDVVSARLFSELAIEATKAGVEVTAMPSVRSCHDGAASYAKTEHWRGGLIHRVWRPAWRQSSNRGRLGNALAMLMGWTWRAIFTRRSADEVVIIGTDPILSVLIAIPWRLFRPKARIIHWCHDVYPDAAIADGLVNPNSVSITCLNWLLRLAYRRCDVIADLGGCMRERLKKGRGAARESGGQGVGESGRREGANPGKPSASSGVNKTGKREEAGLQKEGMKAEEGLQVAGSRWQGTAGSQEDGLDQVGVGDGGEDEYEMLGGTKFITVTPWSLVEPDDVVSADQRVRRELFGDAKLGLLYSGNLGRAHEFEAFLHLARCLRNDPVAFCYAGRGPQMEELKQIKTEEDSNIHFAGFAAEQELELRLAAADVHMVSLRESWTGSVVPSKFFGALAVGRPVLFAGSTESAIARWIQQYNIGWVLNSESIAEVASHLKNYANDHTARTTMNQRCWGVYRAHFDRAGRIRKLLNA